MPLDLEALRALGLEQTIPEEINGRRNGAERNPEWDAAYHPCPEAFPENDIPRGEVRKYSVWRDSKVYAGTTREIWLYKPANFDTSKTQRLMLFNDGLWYAAQGGPVRATHVLDSLHATGEIASTIAAFIMPGQPDESVNQKPIASYGDREAQRSLEYDALLPHYGEFLFGEILPFAERELKCKVSPLPEHRTVCGISSGGIAAFTSAWHHTRECTRVMSHCGSYTNIWGGHNVPSMVRALPRKPIRIFLQSGEHDANTPFGDWALANKTMASALSYAGYDYRFEYGTGGHSLNHGGAIFADSLRWLWRDEP